MKRNRNVCVGSSRSSSSTRESRSGLWTPLRAAEPSTGVADDLDCGAVDLNSLCSSVVKVYSDFTDPNYALPWQMQRQGSSTGSGFIVHPSAGGGERIILTNAHCVAWNNRLHLRKHGSPIKFPARVLAVAHECDLAVLTVDNDDFWADTQGLLFGEDGVIVLGYPRGGDNLCITSGVVSRVDVNTYAHSNTA
ncbi:trypsin, putative [Eimeria mitis]|uniref:Trypsin, putative n=1 Tax=Eimeria mitis TaxID=44415 RepID=U6KML2_9EIME|nr:trypsin, putative [Eimeria mitis]CDJ36693.1 trypsin, putative [Eimeria mitis]